MYRGWGTEHAVAVERLTATEAEAMVRAGEVGAGSMAPKLQAAAQFVRGGSIRRAVVAHLDQGPRALRGETGTLITGDAG